jgi:large subunit ribosomal protein L22
VSVLPALHSENTVVGHNSQARLSQAEARRIFARVHGMTAAEALHALRFSAGTVCPPVARIVSQAVATAEQTLGVGPDRLVVAASEVADGETVVRVRRQAHGVAGWITTETTDIRVELRLAPPVRSDR